MNRRFGEAWEVLVANYATPQDAALRTSLSRDAPTRIHDAQENIHDAKKRIEGLPTLTSRIRKCARDRDMGSWT